MFRILYLSLWVAFTIIGTASADSPVDIPDVHIGDIWKYRRLDGFTNETLTEFSQRIVDLNDKEITIQRQDNEIKTVRALGFYTREWNSLDVGVGKFTPYYPDLRFPISVGNIWKQEFKYSTTKGKSYSAFIKAKVVVLEKITVPAGTFDAYKVEKDFEIIGTDENANTSKEHVITWYAPVVKKFVRMDVTQFSNGRIRIKSVDELVEYSLQGKSVTHSN